MADWQRKLVLQPEWGQAERDEISVQTLAGVIAIRLRALNEIDDDDAEDERLSLADDFDTIAGETSATKGGFDRVMERLYDWADTALDSRWNGRKVCWIDRFTQPESP